MAEDYECVCEGNWRKIVRDNEHRIGKPFRDSYGKTWILFGIVHADDDYYYGLHRAGGELKLCTCVASLEQQGYTQEPEP